MNWHSIPSAIKPSHRESLSIEMHSWLANGPPVSRLGIRLIVKISLVPSGSHDSLGGLVDDLLHSLRYVHQ